MQVHIIAVGKIKEKYLQLGISEYEKRLRPYVKLQIIEISEEKRPASTSTAIVSEAKEKEGERILAVIPEGSYVIALDVQGQSWSSEELAGAFRRWELAGQNHLAFVIGGDLGLSPAILTRSDLRLSLSKLTFTHTMARLLVMEQVYRAFRILRGEPYHK
ncbi:MAG: 23S rRNA (pseudouridine(1915)-N(3))-methyltransferase RlmH [Methanoregula sp.]|jgi:23S rRNA (pseudouridine1915-N3)-methyltransferase|nr:23S rRNA (pseudouridine(1915)-N(3))-methyltransferase RlmH [Methanoregula sp.]